VLSVALHALHAPEKGYVMEKQTVINIDCLSYERGNE
jgi:hypothetical protein